MVRISLVVGRVSYEVATVLAQKVEKKFEIRRQILSLGGHRPYDIAGLKGFTVKGKAG